MPPTFSLPVTVPLTVQPCVFTRTALGAPPPTYMEPMMPPTFEPVAMTSPSKVQPMTSQVPTALSRRLMMPPTMLVPLTVAWLTQFSIVPCSRPAKEPMPDSVPV